MKQNMITGSPAKSLFFFALPMVLGNIFQQVYNITDSLIVGNFVGEKALAAVGASFAITMLFVSIAIGAGIGSGVVISQLFGAKQLGKMKTAVYTSVTSITAISVVLLIVGVLINKPILRLMGTPESIYADAVTYLQVYFYGIIFMFLYNSISTAFNALGDSKTPLYFLIFSSLLNIGLDIWFVAGFRWGVAGAAWATVVAQGVAALLSFAFLMKKLRNIETEEQSSFFDFGILKKIFAIAFPSIIQQSIVSTGMLFVQTVVNRFGPEVVAGYTAATKIDSVAIVPMLAVGNAMSTFTAQNIGAKKTERVGKGYRAALLMVAVMGLLTTALIIIFGESFVKAFMGSDGSAKAISSGVECTRVVGLFYVLFGFMNVTNGVLRGAGSMIQFMLSSLGSLGIRVLIAYSFAGIINEMAVWIASPIGWFTAFAFAFICFVRGKWKNKSVV